MTLEEELQVEPVQYHPLRELKSLRGTLAELTQVECDRDYVFVTLTDALAPLDPVGSLLMSYPMQMVWPVAAICLTMLSLHFIGDGLSEALDPRKR